MDGTRSPEAGRGWRATPTRVRTLVILTVGVAAAVVTGVVARWDYAPLIGWGVAALTFEVWAGLSVGRLDAAQTAAHATREDPSRAVSDLLLLGANVASLAAVAYVVVDAGQARGSHRVLLAAMALASVAISWVLVQTLFTLRYASLYYRAPEGGIEFNQTEPPRYSDFAYIAFTMGMTYQVSDTNLQTSTIRASVLRHGLLSYVFGSVILATTINLVVGLSGNLSG